MQQDTNSSDFENHQNRETSSSKRQKLSVSFDCEEKHKHRQSNNQEQQYQDEAQQQQPQQANLVVPAVSKLKMWQTTSHIMFTTALDMELVVDRNRFSEFTVDLPTSLLQFLSNLYFEQQPHQNSVVFVSTVQNVDLQSSMKRLGQDQGAQHYTSMQFMTMNNTPYTVEWIDELESSSPSASADDNGHSNHQKYSIKFMVQDAKGTDKYEGVSPPLNNTSSTSSLLLQQMSPLTNHHIHLTFVPPITPDSFQRLCHVSTEFVFRSKDTLRKHFNIYMGNDEDWELLNRRRKRDWDSIFLPASIKDAFIQDFENFLKSRSFYEEKNFRYKRNYLLVGPPGLAKSSFVEAVASRYGLDLCIINFTRLMDDAKFMRLVSEIKPGCALLLEDIDSLGLGSRDDDDGTTCVSYACILNFLDGPCQQLEQVFMTANDKNKLDPSFKRHGRIDRIFEFEHMKEPEVKGLFHYLLPDKLHSQWGKFWDGVQHWESKLTGAALSNFFIANRHVPDICKCIPEFRAMLRSVDYVHSETSKLMSH